MSVTRYYNHEWYGWQSYEEEILPTEENVKEHIRKSVGYEKSQLVPHRILCDIGKTAYDLEGKFADIVWNALIEHCTEDELKYILSTTRKHQKVDEIEEAGLYWKELAE